MKLDNAAGPTGIRLTWMRPRYRQAQLFGIDERRRRDMAVIAAERDEEAQLAGRQDGEKNERPRRKSPIRRGRERIVSTTVTPE